MDAAENFLRKYNIFFLIIILALAVFFRLYQLTTIPPGLYPDEAMNGNNAIEALGDGSINSFLQNAKVFYPENNGREGLFINIQALSIKLFGNEPWALRLVSAVFGIFTVLGLYFLAKQLFKKESVALISSFFLATSFWHINFSRIGFRAIMAPFFLVWSFWLLWKSLGSSTPKWTLNVQVWIAGLLFGLGLHSYIAYRAAPLLLIPPFLILLKKRSFKPILLFLIGAAISAAPLLLYFYNNPQDFFGRTAQVSIFSLNSPLFELAKNILKTAGMFFVVGDMNWRHNLAGAPQLWWPLSALFLIGLILSLKTIFKHKQNPNLNPPNGEQNLFLWTWLIVMLLPVIISSEGLPHALRAIITIIPVMIFCALGLVWLIEKIILQIDRLALKFPESPRQISRIKKELLVLLFAFLITVSIQAYRQYFIQWAGNPHVYYAFSENYRELGSCIKLSSKDTKKYVIINADGAKVRGIPMPSQTVMFITDTFSPEKQKEKNIFYALTENMDDFISAVKKEKNAQIFMLENDPFLRQKLSDNIPELFSLADSGILIQEKENE
jgi:hypothetical protein